MKRALGQFGDKLNSVVEKLIGVLMLMLLLDVWVGVLDRYVFGWQIAWVEEIARYLMIWTTLLAISCGINKREHIGVFVLLNKLPARFRIWLLLSFDLVALAFFLLVFYLGIDFAQGGLKTYIDSIFGVSMFVPYLAVPVFALLSAVQTFCVLFRDFGQIHIYDLDYKGAPS